MGEALLL